MSSNLLLFYQKLLKEYDKILSLTDKLVYALQSREADDTISSLLDERLKIMQRIQKMTKNLSCFTPSNSQKTDLQIIEQLKSIHSKLEEKANLLKNKEKELEKLAEDLD